MLSGFCRYRFLEQKWLAYKSWFLAIEFQRPEATMKTRAEYTAKHTKNIVFRFCVAWIRHGFTWRRGLRKSTRNARRLPNQNLHHFLWESTPEPVPLNPKSTLSPHRLAASSPPCLFFPEVCSAASRPQGLLNGGSFLLAVGVFFAYC